MYLCLMIDCCKLTWKHTQRIADLISKMLGWTKLMCISERKDIHKSWTTFSVMVKVLSWLINHSIFHLFCCTTNKHKRKEWKLSLRVQRKDRKKMQPVRYCLTSILLNSKEIKWIKHFRNEMHKKNGQDESLQQHEREL